VLSREYRNNQQQRPVHHGIHANARNQLNAKRWLKRKL